jgi:hypothetical protein
MAAMCPRFFINKEWIVSATARRVYLATTILNILLMLLTFASPARLPESLITAVTLLLFICAIGAATTLVAMIYHFVLFKVSSVPRSIACAITLAFFPIGPPFYFFFAYWRSPEFRVPSEALRMASGN